MKNGAFALVDCLGFKGIWKDHNPQHLIKKLRQIEKAVAKSIKSSSGAFKMADGKIKPTVRLLSDTVAISFQPINRAKDRSDLEDGRACAVICAAIVDILLLFLLDEPNLVMRGCISFGKHITTGNFIAGPAVDEAAEYMNVSQGAFVWLLPSAAKPFSFYANELTKETEENFERGFHQGFLSKDDLDLNIKHLLPNSVLIDDYPMPLKGGGYLNAPVINPLIKFDTQEEDKEIMEIYSKAMSGEKLDIWQKRQNTLRFLETASSYLSECRPILERWNPIIPSRD